MESISALKAITGAVAGIEDLANEIEGFTAQCTRLNTEIKNHEKEVAEYQASTDAVARIEDLAN